MPYTVHHIQGIGHRVLTDKGRVIDTFDTPDEAEEHKDLLNEGKLKESDLWQN